MLVDQHQSQLRQHIYKLRYNILVTEQHKQPTYADHSNKLVKEPLDDTGLLFAHIDADEGIGSCRVNRLTDLQDLSGYPYHCLDYFSQHAFAHQVGIASRLLLHPSYRRTNAFKLLVKSVVKTAFDNGISILIIDGVLSLERLYFKLGFLPYGIPFTHKDGMEVTPMILDANNQNRLREINSLLLDCYPANYCGSEAIKTKVDGLIKLRHELEVLS
ncbi:hypothetical protein [Flavisolibacter tropicus]|uniref:N-acetyltransferase domain-containing protein n=1 Tax=Flavisolibacter tropicus TaxID=1492898 RepID=A0A172TVU6_9BACT|nr:hypothetical protein [Flavisolibacter tropicus]ANE51122.1 hypothetical protein SY85_12030 [Flavisolibacter tropicus]